MSSGDRQRESAGTDPSAPDSDRTGPDGTGDDASASPHSWWPWGGGGGVRGTLAFGGAPGADPETVDDDAGSGWDDEMYVLLFVVGALLFVFPEPATSAVGIVLLVVGAVGWVVERRS